MRKPSVKQQEKKKTALSGGGKQLLPPGTTKQKSPSEMKKKTKKQYTQKDVAKTAYIIIYSADVLLLRRDIGYITRKMLDMR